MGRASTNYPGELRERAVLMVAEVGAEYPSEWAAIEAVAKKLAVGSAETQRKWVRQTEVDAGGRLGMTSLVSREG
jgi:transposase